MDLKRQKELANRLLNKNSVLARVTVKSEALNSTEPVKSLNVRLKLLQREAEASDDAAVINGLMSATPFPVEGGEVLVNGTTYDITKVTQSGVGVEHIIQKVVLRER